METRDAHSNPDLEQIPLPLPDLLLPTPTRIPQILKTLPQAPPLQPLLHARLPVLRHLNRSRQLYPGPQQPPGPILALILSIPRHIAHPGPKLPEIPKKTVQTPFKDLLQHF